jgi:hypothetical protein
MLIKRGKLLERITISAKASLGYYELKENKPWFNEGCLILLDQKKEATLQWTQDLSGIYGDNVNHIRRETSRHFRNKKREYLKDLMSLQRTVRTRTLELCIEI